MELIDLHVHSSCSDGTATPSELTALAVSAGLKAFALTDHDSTDGIDEALLAADRFCVAADSRSKVEVIPGIEFSAEYHGCDIHIVGLDMDYHHPDFQAQLTYFRDERLRRNRKMIDRMANDGIPISFESMTAEFGEGIWTRAHFGRYLLEHGYVTSIAEAFSSYIGENCRYFIPREKVSPYEVTALIRRFGGIPILAHPLLYSLTDSALRTLLGKLKEAGLLGMEVYYSTHSADDELRLLKLASDFDLLPSGGSDYHGTNKPDIQLGTGKGNLQISAQILTDLRTRNLCDI